VIADNPDHSTFHPCGLLRSTASTATPATTRAIAAPGGRSRRAGPLRPDRALLTFAAVLALTVSAVAQGPRDASLTPSNDTAMAAAKKVFGTYCASCHGATGLGDGVAAAALQPKPRSFADSKWQRSVSDDHLAKVILDGGPAVGLSPTMAPARSMFDSEPAGTIDAMVAMVREFGRPRTLTVPAIDAAAKIYAGFCSTCHGAAGLGDGAAAAALDPKPRSFTDHAWQRTVSDAHLAKVILEGGPAVALSPLMAPAKAMFANEPDGTIDAVIALVRGFSRTEPVPADAVAAAGKIFATFCSTCHGVEGLGDGAAASALVPRPRSFADRHWQSSVSDAHLQKVILEGGSSVALSPLMGPAKAMFDGLPNRTIDAMVAQVRRLGTPTAITAPAVKAAAKLYAEYCSTCHGATGLGDGAAAAALVPKPRSFADPQWQRSVSDDHVTKVILEGGAAVGLSPTMAPAKAMFASLPEGTIHAMVVHLRDLVRRTDAASSEGRPAATGAKD